MRTYCLTTTCQRVSLQRLVNSEARVLVECANLPNAREKYFTVRFWATVCKTVLAMLSVRCTVCPSVCLSVTFMRCGQMVGWIKMKLGMQVGLGPGHIVLDGDPAPPPPKEHSPPIFGPYQLRPNGCMDQDVT